MLCNHAIEWLSMAIANAISMPPLFKAPLISQALTVSLQLQKKKKGLCNQRKASKKSSINGAARHKLARVSRKGAAAMAAMVVHG